MLLVSVTIDGAVCRVSNEELALAHNWRQHIISFGPIHYAIQKNHGGHGAISYGGIVFSPDLFDDVGKWPPPTSMTMTVQHTASDEERAVTLFVGVAHMAELTLDGVAYDIYPPAYAETVAAATVYADSLNSVLTSILTGISGIDAVDTSLARSPSPAVAHTTGNDQIAITLASDIAAFFGHFFWVSGGTAYLVDMAADNGSTDMTEFEIFADPPPRYWFNPPVAVVKTDTLSAMSGYSYGKELSVAPYQTSEALVLAAMESIVYRENSLRASIAIPLGSVLPQLGERLTWTDTALSTATGCYIRARNIRYDFDRDEVIVEGEGGYIL